MQSLQPTTPEPAPAAATLLDPLAAAAAAAALGQLSRAVSQERTAHVTRGGPSIEDVVREELRPMLKAWLDAHLPATVERLVRAEIEKVMARQG
jgi:cell pole-organizing protein PopZ